MKQKEIIPKIEELLRNGLTKEQIFGELGGTDDIARSISSTPYYEKRAEYKTLNVILASMIFYYAIVNTCISGLSFISAGHPIYLFPLIFFVPICAVIFGVGILKFRGNFYLPAGLLGISVFVKSLGPEMADFNILLWVIWSAINIPLLIAIFVSFNLKKKLCPGLGFLGAKTNKSGSYIFLKETG
ncbi:MAG: hypothetical protein U9R69_01780 [Thermodesulfobacteriota bacterium]|nr:hypothetical protein [Thermodesulfobacteriota bacterium]